MDNHLFLYLIFAELILVLMPPLLTVDYRDSSPLTVNRSYYRNASVLTFLILIIFYLFGSYLIGYRPLDAGFDTSSYVRTYAEINDFFSARDIGKSIFGNTEFLFWPLQSLLKVVAPEPRTWLLLTYTIVFFLSGLSYQYLTKDTPIPAYLFILVFLTYDIVFFGNAIRQSLAFPLGLISIFFLREKKYMQYLLLAFMSISLHWSMIVILLAPAFLYAIRIKRSFLILFYLSLPLLSITLIYIFYNLFASLGINMISSKFELYLTRESHFGNIYSLLNFWICIGFAIIVLIYNNTFRQYQILYVSHSLLLTLILAGTGAADFSERFLYLYIFLTPMILYILLFHIFSWKHDMVNTIFFSTIYVLFFVTQGFMVLMSESARKTLAF